MITGKESPKNKAIYYKLLAEQAWRNKIRTRDKDINLFDAHSITANGILKLRSYILKQIGPVESLIIILH